MKQRDEASAALRLVMAVLAFICVCMWPAYTQAASAGTDSSQQLQNGCVKESGKLYYYANGKRVKNTLKKVSGKLYYFGSDGAAISGRLQKVKGKQYYFGSDAAAVTGWKTVRVSGKWKICYFGTSGSGKYVLQKKKSVDQTLIRLLDQALKKAGVSDSLTAKQKLEKIFTYISDDFMYGKPGGPYDLLVYKSQYRPSGWEKTFAKKMLQTGTGTCYHYAATFALLARRASGLPVRILIGKSDFSRKGAFQYHAWVQVKYGGKWLTFDPLADAFSRRKGISWSFMSSSRAKKIYKKAIYTLDVNL